MDTIHAEALSELFDGDVPEFSALEMKGKVTIGVIVRDGQRIGQRRCASDTDKTELVDGLSNVRPLLRLQAGGRCPPVSLLPTCGRAVSRGGALAFVDGATLDTDTLTALRGFGVGRDASDYRHGIVSTLVETSATPRVYRRTIWVVWLVGLGFARGFRGQCAVEFVQAGYVVP